MTQIVAWEAKNFLPSHQIPGILWKPNVYYYSEQAGTAFYIQSNTVPHPPVLLHQAPFQYYPPIYV